MVTRGKVFKYGDNVDTDVIIPARYLTSADGAKLARHCMEDLDPSFAKLVQKGDLIAAGSNFGCGSSREHAPIAIRASGISCVIAHSFARIFYRNAINTGLPIIEAPSIAREITAGDDISIDFLQGVITNHSNGKVYNIKPFPPFIAALVSSGGLIPYTKKTLHNNPERSQHDDI